jgi:lysophospholipid acyltransferase (LPLAT)-like uncharacterized protein
VKALVRSAPAQATFAFLLAAYLGVALKTIRWDWQGRELAEAIWASGGPVIVCFWHSRIALSPACWPLERAQTPRALISLSADGEFIAKAMTRLGFPAIRGSARNPDKPASTKGGTQALRDMLRWLKGRHGVALTPDGPRGPAETMGEGPLLLARLSKAPVLLVGLACKPCLRLNSWDKAVLPLPFARGAIVWDGPHGASEPDDLQTLRAVWAARLTGATHRAEAVLA